MRACGWFQVAGLSSCEPSAHFRLVDLTKPNADIVAGAALCESILKAAALSVCSEPKESEPFDCLTEQRDGRGDFQWALVPAESCDPACPVSRQRCDFCATQIAGCQGAASQFAKLQAGVQKQYPRSSGDGRSCRMQQRQLQERRKTKEKDCKGGKNYGSYGRERGKQGDKRCNPFKASG